MESAIEAVARAYRTVRETGVSDHRAYLAAREAYLTFGPKPLPIRR